MSRRERQRRRRGHRGRRARPLFLTLGVISAVLTIGVLGVVGWILAIAESAPALSQMTPVNQGASSVVYAADGTRLGFIQSDVLRQPITEAQIPNVIRNATVAIEDKRFYKHGGVDIEGVIRAAIKNVTSGHTVQGGSTLTMQLVKNLYDRGKPRSFKVKIQEAKLADDLQSAHPGMAGKRWILDDYLNNVPYGTVGGQTAIGIQAAARMYFDKPAQALTVPEAALLAGLPQAPSTYNPFLDPAGATARRNEVIRAMQSQGYLTPDAAAAAEAAPLGVRHSHYYTSHREGFFFDYVKQELIKRYGADTVRRGGLKIYTTIDLKLQKLARKDIATELPYASDPAAALVSIDQRNGHILAMASSARYGPDSRFNLAAQAHRQPGSTFKVMALMDALRRGVDIHSTTYESKPLHFIDPASKALIDVQTDDHHYYGRETLFEGLVHSDNTVYMQLGLDLGPASVRQTAYDMGITSHLDAYPSMVLGGLTYGVTPLEMARAYTTVADGGYRLRPVAVTRVVFPGGRVDRSLGRSGRTKVFTDGQTYQAIQAMEANVARGTGTRAQISECPAAGKTGTTSSFTDAWFDGFTTSMTTAVWVGFPKQTTSMDNVAWAGGGGEMFGGNAPAAIWHDFMSVAANSDGRHCGPFPQPKQPFVGAPFYGHYATSGAPGGGTDSSGSYGYNGTTGSGTYGGSGSGTGGSPYNNKNLYESPPQAAPHVGGGGHANSPSPKHNATPPPASPPPAGGGGASPGTGNGAQPGTTTGG